MAIYERTREWAPQENFEDFVEQYDDNPSNHYWSVPFSSLKSWRQLQDFKTKIKTKGRYPSSPCEDRMVIVNVNRDPWETTWSIRGWPEWHSTLPLGITRELCVDLADFVPTHLSFDSGQLAQDAYDAFCTQMPEETSLGNFALELDDILKLIPRLGRSFGETVTNLHLGVSFGALPFVGDLQVLSSIVSRTIAKIERLKALNGKVSRLRFKRTGLYAIPAIPPVIHLGNGMHLQLISADTAFNASARLYANLERLDGLEGVARGLFASLGLNNPMKIIWNAIPFSFVLDWVFRFSNVLGRWSVDPYIGTWAVDDFVWSVKTVSTWSVLHTKTRYPFPLTEFYTDSVGYVHASSYVRQVGLPASVNYFTVPPTAGQAALGLSLLSAQSSHR